MFAFKKINYIIMAVSFLIIVLGFCLMAGGSSTEEAFDPSIFDARHTKIAPITTLLGFVLMGVGIMYRPRNKK